MADVNKAVTYGATGAALGAPLGPVGAAVGGIGGALYGLFSGGGSTAPPVSAPQPYGGVDPNAFGPLPVNYGGQPSQGTTDLQTQARIAATALQDKTDAFWREDPGVADWMVAVGPNGAEVSVNDPDPAKRAAARQRVLQLNPYAGQQLQALQQQYQPQIDAANKAVAASQHQDQLGVLTQAAGAAQGRQAPQISNAPGTVDMANAPFAVKWAQAAISGGKNFDGSPLTDQQRQQAQQTLDGYVQQQQNANPLYADRSNNLQDRSAQTNLLTGEGSYIDQLTAASQGKGPSAALDTLYAGRDANINQAQSMANSVRGGSGAQALAARTALLAGANATQTTAQQAAILREQEMQNAQANLNNAYGTAGHQADSLRSGDSTLYGQDTGMATTNAQNAITQGAQNDQMTQYMLDLYYKAQSGDRDAAIQLQQLNSGNYNATIGPGVSAGQANQNSYYAGQQLGDARTGNAINAVATGASAFNAMGRGGGTLPYGPGPANVANGGQTNSNGGDGTWTGNGSGGTW